MMILQEMYSYLDALTYLIGKKILLENIFQNVIYIYCQQTKESFNSIVIFLFNISIPFRLTSSTTSIKSECDSAYGESGLVIFCYNVKSPAAKGIREHQKTCPLEKGNECEDRKRGSRSSKKIACREALQQKTVVLMLRKELQFTKTLIRQLHHLSHTITA